MDPVVITIWKRDGEPPSGSVRKESFVYFVCVDVSVFSDVSVSFVTNTELRQKWVRLG